VDEFAYVPEYLITGVIFPIIPVRSTAFLAVTTFGESPDNFATEMLRKKRFPSLEISLLCQTCYEKGHMDVCKHRAHYSPHWIDKAQQKIMRDALGPERQAKYLREMVGMIINNDSQCFQTKEVEKIFTSARIKLKHPVEYLFVAIDPSGGSVPEAKVTSDFAVCCHIHPFASPFIIVGLDAYVICNAYDVNEPIKVLLNKIMSHHQFYHTSIVLTVEGNLGPTAGYIAKYICDLYPGRVIVVGTYSSELKVGLEQTNYVKSEMFQLTRHEISGFTMCLAETVHTTAASEEVILTKLNKQLNAYKIVSVNGKTTKYSGKGNGQKDDLCIALQIAVYGEKFFYTSGRYARYLL
jgi:hypothetical protein